MKHRGELSPIDHEPGLTAVVDVSRGFRVKRNQADACFREPRDEGTDRLDHQVHVDQAVDCVWLDRLADVRADHEVRHVVIVHDIEVNPIRAGMELVAHFLAETRKLRARLGSGKSSSSMSSATRYDSFCSLAWCFAQRALGDVCREKPFASE